MGSREGGQSTFPQHPPLLGSPGSADEMTQHLPLPMKVWIRGAGPERSMISSPPVLYLDRPWTRGQRIPDNVSVVQNHESGTGLWPLCFCCFWGQSGTVKWSRLSSLSSPGKLKHFLFPLPFLSVLYHSLPHLPSSPSPPLLSLSLPLPSLPFFFLFPSLPLFYSEAEDRFQSLAYTGQALCSPELYSSPRVLWPPTALC